MLGCVAVRLATTLAGLLRQGRGLLPSRSVLASGHLAVTTDEPPDSLGLPLATHFPKETRTIHGTSPFLPYCALPAV